jgi:hypothetical protein
MTELTVTRNKQKPSEKVVAISKENMKLEYEFYDFIKERFYILKTSLGIHWHQLYILWMGDSPWDSRSFFAYIHGVDLIRYIISFTLDPVYCGVCEGLITFFYKFPDTSFLMYGRLDTCGDFTITCNIICHVSP